MKKLMFIVACLALLAAPISCNEDCVCDEGIFYLKVISPVANQTFSQDFNVVVNKVVIKIYFNQAVAPSSVVANQTVLLESDGNPVSCTTSLNGSNTILTVTSVPTVGSFCVFDPDCGFSITLIGTDTGNGAITDMDGNAMDGDDNDTLGGDYTTAFGILG